MKQSFRFTNKIELLHYPFLAAITHVGQLFWATAEPLIKAANFQRRSLSKFQLL